IRYFYLGFIISITLIFGLLTHLGLKKETSLIILLCKKLRFHSVSPIGNWFIITILPTCRYTRRIKKYGPIKIIIYFFAFGFSIRRSRKIPIWKWYCSNFKRCFNSFDCSSLDNFKKK